MVSTCWQQDYRFSEDILWGRFLVYMGLAFRDGTSKFRGAVDVIRFGEYVGETFKATWVIIIGMYVFIPKIVMKLTLSLIICKIFTTRTIEKYEN